MFKNCDGPSKSIKKDDSKIESKNPNFLGMLKQKYLKNMHVMM
jgi:hypothetical protein